MRLCGGAGIGYDRSVTRSGGQIALGSPYFFSVSLRLPTAFWILPSTSSVLPSASSLASPVALPMVSLIEPLISFADPAIRSLFMAVYSYCGHKFRASKRRYDEGFADPVDRTGGKNCWGRL